MRIAGLFTQNIATDARLDPDPEEPLGMEYVLAAAAGQDHDVQLFTPLDVPLKDLSLLIAEFQPDILAISVYTPHVPAALDISSQVRRTCPNIVVVVGGPHPTADPSIVMNPEIDFAVLGEGEAAFCELLSVLEEGADPRFVDSVAFVQNDEVVITAPRRRVTNLDALPYPIYERRYYDLPSWSVSSPPMSQVVYSPMLFSRGCNMPCRFCSSRDLWGGEVHSRTPANALAEMRHLRDEYGVNFVFFEDLTFTLKKKSFLGLCRLIEEENTGVYWGCETHLNTVTPEDLRIMRNAGCRRILWGVESLNERFLDQMGKKLTPAKIRSSLSTAADFGILNWGCCIIGFPWETEQDILQNAADVQTLDIHQLRISIATPLPGSQWHKEMPKSQLHPDLSLYDTNHLVYDHPTISPERMKELQNEVFIRFYCSPEYHEHVIKMTKKFPHLRESFDEFLAYIDSQIELLETGQKDITQVYTLDKFAGRKVPT